MKPDTDDRLSLDYTSNAFFSMFTNCNHQQPDWEKVYNICISEILVIKISDAGQEVYNLQAFIEPRKKMLSDGTLTEFQENEISEETIIVGNIAQRFSKYQKCGYYNGIYFKEYGNKFFQFIKTKQGWKISSVIWEDEKK